MNKFLSSSLKTLTQKLTQKTQEWYKSSIRNSYSAVFSVTGDYISRLHGTVSFKTILGSQTAFKLFSGSQTAYMGTIFIVICDYLNPGRNKIPD
jgi:hypothetical protein